MSFMVIPNWPRIKAELGLAIEDGGHKLLFGLESSPKLVEIFHGSRVHVTPHSLSWPSHVVTLVGEPHGAWASADSP